MGNKYIPSIRRPRGHSGLIIIGDTRFFFLQNLTQNESKLRSNNQRFWVLLIFKQIKKYKIMNLWSIYSKYLFCRAALYYIYIYILIISSCSSICATWCSLRCGNFTPFRNGIPSKRRCSKNHIDPYVSYFERSYNKYHLKLFNTVLFLQHYPFVLHKQLFEHYVRSFAESVNLWV